ncbi:MAG: S-layer homology domain-containing protein [Bacillota bacterium]
MKTINRTLILLLAVSFLVTILPMPAPAKQPPITLQKAIETAKLKFEIPLSYTDFTSQFSDYDNNPTWSLNWRAAGDAGGSFSVDINANTGEITAMDLYQPDVDRNPAVRIPSCSVEEAAKIAESFLKRIVPGRMSELRLVSPLKQSENTYYGMGNYTFYWQRVVGNIPVRGERAVVRVDKFKGKVVSYQLNCTSTSFPSAARVVSASHAQQAFKDAGMFELQYLVAPQYLPLSLDKTAEPVLVYRLTHKSGGLIDANTGKPFIIPSGQYLEGLDIYAGAGANMEKRAALADQAANVELTPEEQEEIIKHANLLTQQEACEIVFQWVPAAKNMSLRSANLEAVYGQPQIRCWNVSFIKKDNGKDYRVYARLDASTGELQSFFYDYPRDSFDAKKAKSREELEKTARDFLKRVQPEKSRYIRLDPDNETQTILEDQAPTSYFNYNRLVNNIPVTNHGISVTVDSITGEIVEYSLNWPDLKFPAPTGIMNYAQAVAAYLKQLPLTLCYCKLTSDPGVKDVRLVYIPWNDFDSSSYMMLDARTGKLLNRAGQPLPEPPATEAFNDLNGIPGQREINILGQMGFFREYGNSFKPNQPVTLVSFLRALILARDGNKGVYDLDDAEVLKSAKSRGWLTEDLAPTTALNRATTGRIIIRYLNLEQVARLQDIYVNYYKDIKKGDSFIGYAAILKGYQIMEGKGSNFSPTATVSRADAAQYIFRMSKVNLN